MVQGDIGLQPERNSTAKLGLAWQHRGLQADLSAFYSDGRNMIDWVFATDSAKRYQAMNIGRLRNMGITALFSIDFNALLGHDFVVRRIALGYAHINQTHSTDRPIYRSLYALEYLRHKLTLQLDHRIWRDIAASWQVRWQQRMNGYPPYWKVDAKIAYNRKHYSLYVQADNLTNTQYYDLGGVQQPGIWVMAGCAVHLGW